MTPSSSPRFDNNADVPAVDELERITAMERAVAEGDRRTAAGHLAADVRYRVGGRPVVVGIDAVFAFITAQSERVRWTGHTLHGSWSDGRVVVVEVDSHFELVEDIAAVAVSSAILKGAGPALIGGRDLPARTQAVITLLAPALLAALVLVETVGPTTGPALDARTAGVSAAAISLCLRAPLLVVVGAATAATALARLFGA